MLLTEDERLLQDSVREFVQKEALPKMAECAELQGPWPIAMGLWPRMAELGYIGISTPEEMGGFGLSVKKELLVCEAIAQAGSLGINLDAHNLALRALEFNGSDYQKEKWGVPAARGDIMLAAAITDPAGSMNFPEWSISVKEDGDDLILNGSKNFFSNSHGADAYAIAVKDFENGYPMGFVMVDADNPGLEMGEFEFQGLTGGGTGTIYLNDVRVPKINKLPSADFGNAAWLSLGYLDAAVIMVAASQAALNIALQHVQNRTRNGRPLAKLQSVAHRIVNMQLKIEQARALAYEAAEHWDAGEPDLKLHSMAKIAAAECVTDVTKECCYLLGGYGMGPGSGTYELYSFAVSCWVGENPNDFHRDLIAGLMGMPQDSWLNDPVTTH